ncbi:hypothetical protein RFI_25799 [Reticulomyxa filosa]|uniref:Uncharacterized protein n=1 Tax=Reticulomyxa filosa TaxID=46433 RepID=X6MC34_RETFI|nr:hypothetical protein RFI_25799 [Reticulomyxa filosa]|eukprot:ETO11578.1 hypothetical protein RFI_25799 [Reticulomyxa filosa]
MFEREKLTKEYVENERNTMPCCHQDVLSAHIPKCTKDCKRDKKSEADCNSSTDNMKGLLACSELSQKHQKAKRTNSKKVSERYNSECIGTYHVIDPTLYTYELALNASIHSHVIENHCKRSPHLAAGTDVVSPSTDFILTGEKSWYGVHRGKKKKTTNKQKHNSQLPSQPKPNKRKNAQNFFLITRIRC